MAPINLPDGTEVSEVVLPDGSTASEVVAPDGSTVFGGIADVEDFEDGDLAEWSGGTGVWSVNQTAPVPNGQFRLEKTSAGSGSMRSSSGLSDYPERGDIFAFQLIPGDSGGQPGFEFFGASSGASYELFMDVNKGNFILRDRSGFTNLDSVALPWTLGQEYTIEIDTSTGDDIVCTATDESDGSTTTISATDGTYNSTGIGIRDNNSSSGTGTVWDHIRITDPA